MALSDLLGLVTTTDRYAAADPWADGHVEAGTRFYHGGAGGLKVGGFILPPTETGAPCTIDYAPRRAIPEWTRRRVFMTTDLAHAAAWARHAPGGGGAVYEVRPVGPVRLDPMSEGSYATRARIMRVVPPDEWGDNTERPRALTVLTRRLGARTNRGLTPPLVRWAAHRPRADSVERAVR